MTKPGSQIFICNECGAKILWVVQSKNLWSIASIEGTDVNLNEVVSFEEEMSAAGEYGQCKYCGKLFSVQDLAEMQKIANTPKAETAVRNLVSKLEDTKITAEIIFVSEESGIERRLNLSLKQQDPQTSFSICIPLENNSTIETLSQTIQNFLSKNDLVEALTLFNEF